MLSYRHAFHAGNHADVLKHCVLVAMLRHLNLKDKPWWYVDTHAGAGIYDLESDYARKLSEYESGIGRLWSRTDLPPLLEDYVGLVRILNPGGNLRLYPGSPWLANRLRQQNDQLRLFELHSRDSEWLAHTFAEAGPHVKIAAQDGFNALKAVLPPPPRRGLVLIDPSYEIKDDYRRIPTALKEGLKRFATGTYAVWLPLLPRTASQQLPERLKRLQAGPWLYASLSVEAPAREGFGMHGSGLFIINPPWTLADALRATLPWLVRVLGRDAAAGHTLESGGG